MRPWSEAGYSLAWWALFFALVLGPLLALGIEAGRYAEARAEAQQAADLAALAAVRMVDVPHYRETGELHFTGQVASVATTVFLENLSTLGRRNASGHCKGPFVDEAADTVAVRCTAYVAPFFHWIPVRAITVVGVAQARFR